MSVCALVTVVTAGRFVTPDRTRRLAVGLAVTVLFTSCPARPVTVTTGPLGVEGTAFERTATAGAVRTYVGMREASTDADRAALAVIRLERAGAFDRSTILLVAPTGSGWVNQTAVASLEYLTGGDLASVAVQYADRPSWLEYLLGTGRAERSVSALAAALHRRLDAIPEPSRPRLVIYGESLGAVAAKVSAGLADRTLLAGLPGAAGTHPADPRVTLLVHPDDPVGWWSASLLVHRPTGWRGTWLPLISFGQVTATLPGAADAPEGHGHHYGRELLAAWRATGVTKSPPPGPAAITCARTSREAVRSAIAPSMRAFSRARSATRPGQVGTSRSPSSRMHGSTVAIVDVDNPAASSPRMRRTVATEDIGYSRYPLGRREGVSRPCSS